MLINSVLLIETKVLNEITAEKGRLHKMKVLNLLWSSYEK